MLAALLMLWPEFGSHWMEIGFLNWLRPRLMVWCAGGTALAIGMVLTATMPVGSRTVT
jgi:hypothetical protein